MAADGILNIIDAIINLIGQGCSGGPCVTPKPRPAEVRPVDPVPCVKPWTFGETKAQHEAKPCPATALKPEEIQQP